MEKELNCGSIDCNRGKKDCCSMLKKMIIPAVLGDDSEGSPFAPCNGAYRNALVEYEANGAMYMYSSDGIYTKMYYTADDMAGMATNQYVNVRDAKTLSDAKDYTNGRIANAKGYTDEEVNAAKAEMTTYVDGADAQTLADAKAYTDSAVSSTSGASVAYVDTHDADTLQSAKDYTDAQVLTLSDSVANEFITKVDSLATVARTGSYSDLNGAPDVPVITMTTTDPGEGAALAANHFIGVYNG